MSAYLGTKGWQAFEDFYERINRNTLLWSADHKRRLLALKRRSVRKSVSSDWAGLVEDLLALQEEALGIKANARVATRSAA